MAVAVRAPAPASLSGHACSPHLDLLRTPSVFHRHALPGPRLREGPQGPGGWTSGPEREGGCPGLSHPVAAAAVPAPEPGAPGGLSSVLPSVHRVCGGSAVTRTKNSAKKCLKTASVVTFTASRTQGHQASTCAHVPSLQAGDKRKTYALCPCWAPKLFFSLATVTTPKRKTLYKQQKHRRADPPRRTTALLPGCYPTWPGATPPALMCSPRVASSPPSGDTAARLSTRRVGTQVPPHCGPRGWPHTPG